MTPRCPTARRIRDRRLDRPPCALRARRRGVREPRRDRPPLPDRPPARLRDHVDRPARRGDRRRHPRRALAPGGGRGAAAVSGPGVAWYLRIAAFLFGTGSLGVLLRRNPLIVLLSLEIMLTGPH